MGLWDLCGYLGICDDLWDFYEYFDSRGKYEELCGLCGCMRGCEILLGFVRICKDLW